MEIHQIGPSKWTTSTFRSKQSNGKSSKQTAEANNSRRNLKKIDGSRGEFF
jgi:hypothetical protein